MKNYAKLPFQFDVTKLQHELSSLVTTWEGHFNKGYYSGEWSGIPLRKPVQNTHQISPGNADSGDFEDLPILEELPYTKSVLQTIETPKNSVRYLRLTPGSTIKPHQDYDLVFEEGHVRLHIPIATNEYVEFIVADQPVTMKSGECWYADFSQTHSVANYGSTDRIHLVIDCEVNDWLRDLLKDVGVVPEKTENADLYSQYDEPTKRRMIANFKEMGTEVSLQMAKEIEETLQ